MALTKVGSIGVSTGIQFAGVTTIATLNASDNILSVGGTVNFVSDVSIGGTISIGGTLTYEDVTNIDSVGLVTARNGIVVGSGITLSKDGDIFFTGIITGNGSGLTNVGPSLTGSTDNTVVTVTGSNAIQGESTLTYDGSELKILKSSGATVTLENTGNAGVTLRGDADRSGADDYIFTLDGKWNGTSVAAIRFESGADTTNKDDGIISFWTAPAGTKGERVRIDSVGRLLVNTTTAMDTGSGDLRDTIQATHTAGAQLLLARNDTVTIATNRLGEIAALGNDSDGTFKVCGSIRFEAELAHDTNDKPTAILFKTCSDGGTTPHERVRVDSTGDLKIADGDLVISTYGHGIDFSVSSDGSGTDTSEILNDYEEGTFTVTPADASSGGNTSSTTYTGYYTKIGRQVTLIVKMLNIDTTGLTAGNDVFIQGIPYTSMSGVEAVGASTVNANWTSTSTTWLNSSILENDAFVRFHESGDNTSRDYLRWTEINDGTGDIIFSLTYFTA